MVVLLQQKGASVPSMVFLLHGNDIVATIRYLSYERLAPDLTLFAKPSGVALTESSGVHESPPN